MFSFCSILTRLINVPKFLSFRGPFQVLPDVADRWCINKTTIINPNAGLQAYMLLPNDLHLHKIEHYTRHTKEL